MPKGRAWVRRIIIIAVVSTLSACAATSSQETTSISNQALPLSATEPTALSSFEFNQGLEQDLNNKNLNSLQNKVDELIIAKELRAVQPQQFANPLATAKAAADLKQQLVSGMLELSNTFTWRYLRSANLENDKIAAYFRIDSEEGYSYITLWQQANSNKIYDYHPVSYGFSALNFVGAFSQLFTQYSSRKAQLSNIVLALQKNELDKIAALYQDLDPDIKTEPALVDLLLRKYSQTPQGSPALQKALISFYEQQQLTSLLFESYYLQQDNFAQAIKIIENLPDFARQDSKMQSELALLHAYNQDFAQAVLCGRQAILAEPNDNEAYFVLLQVSLLAKDYPLSIELIDVLMTKFDYIIGQDVITGFDNSDNFIRSDEYQQWLKKRTPS